MDKTNKSSTKADRLTVPALGAIGLFFLGAAVLVWFTGTHKWHLLGIKISLRHWENPWWYGTVLIVIMLLAAKDAIMPLKVLQWVMEKLGSLAGIDLSSPLNRCTAVGIFWGTMTGFFFAIHYYYLVPRLAFQIAAVITAGLSIGALHWIFFQATEMLLPRVIPGGGAWRVASIRQSIYLIIWSLLITGPLRAWEARGTEPILSQTEVGIAVALVATWLVMAKWEAPGLRGRARRLGLILALIAAVAASTISWYYENGNLYEKNPPRDRVLLITVDTTRADFLSCYGYQRETSPNIDALAASGARFTRAFCPMGITDPSHASILTGYYPRTHGLLDNHQSVTGNVASMGEVFRDKGYLTAAIVSREHVLPSSLNVPGWARESGPYMWMVKTRAPEAYRRAANFLYKNRRRDMFMWVHFFDPHKSYDFHRGYTEKFTKKKLESKWGDHWLKSGKSYDPEQVQDHRDLYAGEILYMDHWIGKLVDLMGKIEPVPQRKPFVLIIADHGEGMGDYQDRPERFGFGHGGLILNGLVNVPLVISWPGSVPAATVVDDTAESIDVAPTILDYILGVKDYPGQGMSLRPAIEGRAPTDRKAVIQRYPIKNLDDRPYLALPQYALVSGDFKLIHTEGGEDQLYDLGRDWAEKNDLSRQRPVLRDELTGALEEWKKTTPETKASERTLTPSEIRTLRALGYIE